MHHSISRPFATIGMCCLIVLSGAPRLDCLCPDQVCRAACELAHGTAFAGKPESKAACCCHHEKAPRSYDFPVARHLGCDCQMQIVQDELSPVVRDDGQLAQPQVLWLGANDVSLALSRPELRTDRSFLAGLPPADPVSRAQILRI